MGLYDRDYMRAESRSRDYDEYRQRRPRQRAPWVLAAAVVMIVLLLLFSC
ncbi:MAG: hypothetical protein ABR497_09200 [Kiritimatiellia bacterium]